MYDVPTTGSMGPYYCFVSPTTGTWRLTNPVWLTTSATVSVTWNMTFMMYYCDQDENQSLSTGEPERGIQGERAQQHTHDAQKSGWANSQDCSNNDRTGHPCMTGTRTVPGTGTGTEYQVSSNMIHTDIIHGIELSYQTIGIKLLYYVYPFNTHVPIQQTHT